MQCYIYKSLKKTELYLYLANKDDFAVLPEACCTLFGQMEFVMNLELTPDRKLARENTEKVLNHLREKGFFIQIPPTLVTAPLTIQ